LVPWARKPACAKASSWSDSRRRQPGRAAAKTQQVGASGIDCPRWNSRCSVVTIACTGAPAGSVLEQRFHRLGQRVVGELGLRVDSVRTVPVPDVRQSYSSEPRPSASLSRKLFGRISVQFCSM
jgi:hypothetical protein